MNKRLCENILLIGTICSLGTAGFDITKNPVKFTNCIATAR